MDNIKITWPNTRSFTIPVLAVFELHFPYRVSSLGIVTQLSNSACCIAVNVMKKRHNS